MKFRRHTARGNGCAPALAAALCLCAARGAAAQVQSSPSPEPPGLLPPTLFPALPPPPAPPPLIAAPPPEETATTETGAATLPPRRTPARPITSGDGGPVILGEHAGQWKLWDLRWLRTELEFYGQSQDDRQTTEGQPEQSQHYTLLRGTMNLSFESYIGHKNFIDLQGNFNLGYEDQTLSAMGQSEHSTSPTDFYDITARILGESFMPLTLYSRRDELIENRSFASALTTVTWENGGILEVKSDIAPTRVQYFHREQTRTDPLGLSDGASTQDTVALSSSAHLGGNQELSFSYTFDEVDETASTTFRNMYDRHDALLTHDLTFGDSLQHSLHSSLRFYDESGLYAQDRVRLDESLTLRHTDRLRSDYNLSLEDLFRGDQEQRLLVGNATVNHRLFDSLSSTATVGGSLVDIPGDFSSSSEFVAGSLNYTKIVPYGRLGAGVAVGFAHTENGERGQFTSVFDQPHTFNDPFDEVIPGRNIDSISITDQAHIPKIEGLDYTVTTFPDRVEIHRQPFGTITNGQTVLITYRIGPEPGNSIDTTTQTYSLRYSIGEGMFTGLSLYVYHQVIDHTIDAVDPSVFVLDNISDWRYGAEYRIGDLNLLVERQNHDSSLNPYDKMRYEIRYDRRFSRTATLSLELSRDEIAYALDGNRAELNNALARWTQRLGSGFDLRLYLQYRDEHNTLSGDVRGFEQGVELHWRWRQTSVYGTFHNAMLDGSGSSRLSQMFTVGVTRSF